MIFQVCIKVALIFLFFYFNANPGLYIVIVSHVCWLCSAINKQNLNKGEELIAIIYISISSANAPLSLCLWKRSKSFHLSIII